ncbi:MAG: hypothetical protein M0Q41_08540 [Bacteroidales bacterium]|nr:hypothetical protein [Bacteroidales bacterium]
MKNRIGDSSTFDQLAESGRFFPIPVAAVGINRRRPDSYRDQIYRKCSSDSYRNEALRPAFWQTG